MLNYKICSCHAESVFFLLHFHFYATQNVDIFRRGLFKMHHNPACDVSAIAKKLTTTFFNSVLQLQ